MKRELESLQRWSVQAGVEMQYSLNVAANWASQ